MILIILQWLIILAFGGISLSLLFYYWHDKYLPTINGPTVLPIIGNILDFRDYKEINGTMKRLHDDFGKNYRAYFGLELNVVTTDVDLIELAVTSNKTINKGDAYRYLHSWLGTGLLTSSADKWHKRRKMITPAYHFKILEQFIDIFNSNSNIMVEQLQKEVGKSQTDIFPFVNLCALDNICESAMGTQVNAQVATESEFVQATKVMNRITIARSFEIHKAFDFSYKFTEDYQLEKVALKVLHGYTMNIIKSRRDELVKLQNKTEVNIDVHEFDDGAKRKDNFLDLLLKSNVDGQPLTDEDIREEVDTFMFEGHDTVSSAISFAFFLISNHPLIQEQIIDEQTHIFGTNKHRETTLRDLQEMKYLEIVIKETLRLYPSVPMMVREVTEDLMYNNCKFLKATQLVMNIYALHRDPKVFPEPEKFIPERFLPEEVLGRNPFAYIPFSAGHRNCIGQKFAMLEMKSTISKVIRNFELLPLVPKHEPFIMNEIVLRSENGALLEVKNREW